LTGNRFEGTLNVIWGDPRPGGTGGTTKFNLALPNGTTVPLQVDPAEQNATIQHFGKSVVVQGHSAPTPSGEPGIAVEQMTLAPNQSAAPAVVSGTRRVLFLLLRFKGDTQQPHPAKFYRDLTNPLSPNEPTIPATINGFFNKTSWGKLKWQADVGGVGGLNPTTWLTLPHARSYYTPTGWSSCCADLTAIQNDGLKLAKAQGINLAVYDNINFVLNNDLDCCAWGGSIVYNNKLYGATWEPPWGQETATYSHEQGHSIGLPHSGWVYYAYDSPWDVMSMAHLAAKSVKCATYKSANSGNATSTVFCDEPGDGYIAAHKDYLGWIPAANKVEINSKTTKTVTLEADALPLGKGIKMIKVCYKGVACTGSSAHYLTIEARIRGVQFDNGLTGDGVIIHDVQMNRSAISGKCYFNNQSGWAVPVDATPNDYNKTNCNSGGRTWPNYALGNAEFLAGKTYTNTARHVTVKVVKKSGSAYVVQVSRTQ
ncbi:MAG TPA: hypothetical protein VG986_03815, partial [Pseudolabrys sp.]|nr:hypothetical protein [Pseudolabrys sp.]